MGWGGMGGIGEALTGVGKSLLADGLAKRREEREEERKIAKEKRDLQKFDREAYRQIQVEPGRSLWHKVRVNKAGEDMEAPELLTDQSKISELNAEETKKKTADSIAALSLKKLEREEGYADDDRRMELEKHQANMSALGALTSQRELSGQAAMVRANKTGNRSNEDFTLSLGEAFKELDGLAEDDVAAAKKAGITTAEMDVIRQSAIDAAAKDTSADVSSLYKAKLRERIRQLSANERGNVDITLPKSGTQY